MTNSSMNSQLRPGSSEEMLALLESAGRGGGVLAAAYRGAIVERKAGIPEPRVYVAAVRRQKSDPE